MGINILMKSLNITSTTVVFNTLLKADISNTNTRVLRIIQINTKNFCENLSWLISSLFFTVI